MKMEKEKVIFLYYHIFKKNKINKIIYHLRKKENS